MSNWKKVCDVSAVPTNALRKFDVAEVSLIVANYGDGFQVFPPFCPHMHEPLQVSGMLEGGILTCGKHLWQWNMATGERTGLSEKDILLYEAKIKEGEIFVNLEKELTYEWEEEDELEDDDFFDAD